MEKVILSTGKIVTIISALISLGIYGYMLAVLIPIHILVVIGIGAMSCLVGVYCTNIWYEGE